MIETDVYVFVIILELFLVCFGFELIFVRISFIMSKGWCFCERTAWGVHWLLFYLLNGRMIYGLVVEAKVFFQCYPLVINFRSCLGFSPRSVSWGCIWKLHGLNLGHCQLLLSNLFFGIEIILIVFIFSYSVLTEHYITIYDLFHYFASIKIASNILLQLIWLHQIFLQFFTFT